MPTYTEKKLSAQPIFDGHVIRVTVDTVELENGKTSIREVVHHNGGAGIVALNNKGEVALVRQFRYALGQELIEIPAGKIEEGEPSFKTAVRELEEETALLADNWQEFGSIIPTCGYCTEVIHLFLATGLHTGKQNLDEDEFVDVFWLPLEEAVQKVLDGEITDSKTVSGLLRAKMHIDSGKLKI